MKRGGGKRKGAAFERQVCVALSLWVTGGEKKDVFWRSAMSGGRATVIRKRGGVNRQAGDIAAVAPEGTALVAEFFVEAKKVRDLRVGAFLFNGNGTLASFWKKACREARKHGREPMLIACQNNFGTLVILKRHYLLPIPRIESQGNGVFSCVIYRLSDFLEFSYDDFDNRRPAVEPLERKVSSTKERVIPQRGDA